MPITRREFIYLGATAAALSRRSWSAFAPGSPSPFTWHRLRNDAWLIAGAGGNVTVLGDRRGAIVVDSKCEGFGPLLRSEIESRVGPIAALIVTHHHTDHAGGAHYGFEGVRSFAHSALGPRLAGLHPAMITAVTAAPAKWTSEQLAWLERDFHVRRSIEVEQLVGEYARRARTGQLSAWAPGSPVGDLDEITIGGTTLELRHVGPGHTDNDLFIVDKRRNLVVTGDLLFHQHHPYIDVGAGATTVGWQASLRSMATLCNPGTIVVPGHGPSASATAVDGQSRYFDELRASMTQAIRDGKDRATAVKGYSLRHPGFGFAELLPENLGVLYDELTKRR
jgi:cyclase